MDLTRLLDSRLSVPFAPHLSKAVGVCIKHIKSYTILVHALMFYILKSYTSLSKVFSSDQIVPYSLEVIFSEQRRRQ
jgi:hypothetical protein